MTNPEGRAFYIQHKETLSSKDPDIAAIRSTLGFTRPEPIIDIIRNYDASELVQDAIEDAVLFHEGETRRYSTTPAVLHPLRVAVPTPSEEQVTSEATTIRLLHQAQTREGFNIDAYGVAVKIGTEALTKLSNETYGEFLERIKETDTKHPELGLVVAQAKIMILNALDPVGLPVDEFRHPDTRIGMGAQLEKYNRNYEALVDKDHPWHPKVKKAIQIGKNALLNPQMRILGQ